MKKIACILLLLVYGLSSSGMTIQFHYCCGKLKSIRLSPIAEKQCGMKQSLSKKLCCNDKQVELKLKGDQKTEYVKVNFSTPAVLKAETGFVNAKPVPAKTITPEVFAPPPLQKSLCVLYCIYRI